MSEKENIFTPLIKAIIGVISATIIGFGSWFTTTLFNDDENIDDPVEQVDGHQYDINNSNNGNLKHNKVSVKNNQNDDSTYEDSDESNDNTISNDENDESSDEEKNNNENDNNVNDNNE